MGTLTVRENIAFSAALRLPLSVSRKKRNGKVETVINELGLRDVADSKVCATNIHCSILCTVVWEKLVVGNIHEKKSVVKYFRPSRLQTIINCSIYLW